MLHSELSEEFTTLALPAILETGNVASTSCSVLDMLTGTECGVLSTSHSFFEFSVAKTGNTVLCMKVTDSASDIFGATISFALMEVLLATVFNFISNESVESTRDSSIFFGSTISLSNLALSIKACFNVFTLS